MRILITGAAGFMGRNLALGLRDDSDLTLTARCGDAFGDWCAAHELPAPLPCDLTSAGEIASAFASDETFDVVIHLAANGDPAASVRSPSDDLRSGPLALLRLFERIRARRLIYFSSGAVYEGCRGAVHPESPVRPSLPYAIGKLAAEHYVRALRERTQRIDQFVNVRFFGAFGPHEPPRKIFTRLVEAFGVRREAQFAVRGDGANRIDAMYVDDAAAAVRRLIECDLRNETIDLAAGRPLSINELVARAAACFGIRSLRCEHVGAVPEYNEFHADAERTFRRLDWRPRIELEDGLSRLHRHLTAAGREVSLACR